MGTIGTADTRGSAATRASALLAGAAAALLLAVGARADDLAASLPAGLELYASDQLRWEVWRFFDPAPPGGDPDYDFVANRLRFGARYDRPRIAAELAGQYVQLGSLPSHAMGTPGGVLGTGGLYFQHADETHPEALQLKYANLELRRLGGRDVRLQLGRFGYASGLEAASGAAKLEAVKASRLADRMIGEFGWSHFQRSFDGARLGFADGFGQGTLAAFRPTEGGFEDGGNRTIDQIDVAAAAYTLPPGRLVPGAELQGFYYLYDDERSVRARADNTGLPPPHRQDLQIHSFGAHLVGAWRLGSGEADLLLWGLAQRGRWLGLDHRAAAGALEAGYQLDGLPGRPWLRAGVFRGSGDGSPDDSRHETFFQMLPTGRLYSLTTAYNLMNSTDSFVELRLAPHPQLGLRLDVHDLRLSSRRDLWYAGSGATQNDGTIFGFAGRRSGGGRHLGRVAELSASWRIASFLTVHGFAARLWGGDVVRASFADDDDLDFFYLELELRRSVRSSRPGS